ncbi:hypothetical protein R1flu_001097 [Riccia fluitans]|uniref:Death domain-containing protein n=1 Tax=Riccia fluitans TaxID=41844 RepID=A0ABD1Y2C5_9MARC
MYDFLTPFCPADNITLDEYSDQSIDVHQAVDPSLLVAGQGGSIQVNEVDVVVQNSKDRNIKVAAHKQFYLERGFALECLEDGFLEEKSTYVEEEQIPMWEDIYKEALEQLEEKAQLLGLTHHERQKMIDIFKSWINHDDNPKLVPLVDRLDEVNSDPNVELRPLDELQDNYQSPPMDDETIRGRCQQLKGWS